jgi:hypothetical protein
LGNFFAAPMGIEGKSQSGVASGERGRLGQNRPSDSQELSDEPSPFVDIKFHRTFVSHF